MKNIKDVLVVETSSIRKTMEIIDSGALKLAFVVDEAGKLLATVSDGDIRRGLLQNSNIDDPVSSVMNKHPHSLINSSTIEERMQVLNANNLHCLPILSDFDELVGIFTRNSLNEFAKLQNPVFIMAGGFGKRLKPLTDKCPKPMLPVGGTPLLELIVKNLKSQGFYNFFFSTHFLPEIIKDYFGDGSKWAVNIKYVHENKALGTGGALSLLPEEFLDLPVVILNGDVFTDLDFTKLLEFHKKNDFDATMSLREIENQISYGVIETEGNAVTSLKEKPVYRHKINMGAYIVSPNFVKSMVYNTKIDLPEHIECRMGNGHKIGAMQHSGYWLDIGKLEDYEKAQREIKELYDF
ncbi:nucleotidyltransferase family protein [Planktomarina sp.]|nr:nucleotidyltransferase family protein [Planktomarina sp.]